MTARLTPFAIFIAVGLGLALAFLIFQKQRERESAQYSTDELLRAQQARAAFAKLIPSEALKQCRQSWDATLSWSSYYLPLAAAWSHQGVDGYYLQGVDTTSLRHFHCDADGSVQRGKRFVRPGMESIAAESPVQKDAAAIPDLIAQKLAEQTLAPDLVALELYLAPDQNMFVRRWQGAERLEVSSSPSEEKFPLLLQTPPAAIQIGSNLKALTAHNWVREPAAALALLAAQLPVDARILKVRLDEDEIEVTIAGPIPAFDNKPPAPSGDMEYDEYGVAARSWWYPREVASRDCINGEAMTAVAAKFNAQYQAQINYSWLIYKCAKGWQMKRPKK